MSSKYTRYMANLFSYLYDRFHYENGISKFLLSNFRCDAMINSGNDYYLEMCERVLCRIKENIDVLDRNGCCPSDIVIDCNVSDALQNIAVYCGIIMFLKDRYNIERTANSDRVKQYIANDEECETEGEDND